MSFTGHPFAALTHPRTLRLGRVQTVAPHTSWLADHGAMLAIVVFGTLLRLPGLRSNPLEQDELYTVMESRLLWDVPLAPGIDARPLYFLMEHGLLRLFPDDPAFLRAPALIFGVAGIALAGWAATRLFGGPAGLLAALLVALSPWHLHASGMARYWTLLFALGAGFYFYLAHGRVRDDPRDHTRALVLLLLGMATHPTFLFPAAGAALGVTLVDGDGRFGWYWPTRRAWTWLWEPFLVILGAAWLALRLLGRGGAVQNWSGRGWEAGLRLVPAMVEWAGPAVVAAGVLGAVLLFMETDARRRCWGAMTLVGAATTLLLLLAAAARTDVYADYAMAMLPLPLISAGALVQLTVERARAGGAVLAACIAGLLVAGSLPAVASHLSDGTRFDYRPAFARVRAEGPDRLVVAWPTAVQRHYAPELRARGLPMPLARMDSLLAAEREMWVVASVKRHGIALDEDGSFARWLDGKCRRDLVTERPRLDYRVYRVELWHCRAGG